MSIPTYDHFIAPLLARLAAYPNGVAANIVQNEVATQVGLTDQERQELLPSGMQQVFKNRIGWAHDRLKRAGLSSSPRRGYWQLTEAGIAAARQNPSGISKGEVQRIAFEFRDVRLRSSGEMEHDSETPRVPPPDQGEFSLASPDERLEQALAEIRKSVSAEMVEALGRISPSYFEVIVLDLLHRMGYGANREDLQRVGRSGDEGIDGVISLDRLGLDKVYVQAKKWQGAVGRPEVQAFYGALAGQRAKRGVFITTSTFTRQASEFARSVEGIVLVDGSRLANLMIDHEVGVSSRTIRIPKLDGDYFDEGAS